MGNGTLRGNLGRGLRLIQTIMDAKNIKVACCGPSGSGKTTLCQGLQKELGLRFIPSSVGLIFGESQKKKLAEFGYENKGHQNVINMSNANPEFGKLFQEYALEARNSLISNGADQLIVDRSPVDNVTYASLQCLHNWTEEEFEKFYGFALDSLCHLTHIIYVKSVCPDIEVNFSRVANKHYQHMVDQVFEYYLAKMSREAGIHGPKILVIDTWPENPMDRVIQAKEFILED